MNKTQKESLCREILYSVNVGEEVCEKDFNFLISIFKNHCFWETKKGDGVVGITTMRAKFGTVCFKLLLKDGDWSDISFKHAISPPSKKTEVKQCCRDTVEPIIYSFKKSALKNNELCVLSGDKLISNNVDIDHYDTTFDEMFNKWIEDKSIDDVHKFVDLKIKQGTVKEFTNENIKQDFINFHNNNTKLRALTRTAHKSLRKNKN